MSDSIIHMPSTSAMIALASALSPSGSVLYFVADDNRRDEVKATLPNVIVPVFGARSLCAFTAKYIFLERVADPYQGREGSPAELAALRTALYPGGLVFVLE